MSLSKIEAIKSLLARIETVPNAKAVRDKAEMLRVYAKAAGYGLETQNMVAEIKLRAERKAGELLDEIIRHEGGKPSHDVTVTSDFGIDRMQSHRWQFEYKLPEAEFEHYIAETKERGGELTSRDVYRMGRAWLRVPIETPPLPEGKFRTIVVDPPWDPGDEGDVDQMGRAQPLYPVMPFEDILALPIGELAAEDSHIYLWITNRSLPKGFDLLEAWSFRYVTCLTWVKPSFGMGNYFRGSTEHILFGVRGSLPILRKDVGTHFTANRSGSHSRKPDEFYRLVETCSPEPRIDMFYGKKRDGWMAWGQKHNE